MSLFRRKKPHLQNVKGGKKKSIANIKTLNGQTLSGDSCDFAKLLRPWKEINTFIVIASIHRSSDALYKFSLKRERGVKHE